MTKGWVISQQGRADKTTVAQAVASIQVGLHTAGIARISNRSGVRDNCCPDCSGVPSLAGAVHRLFACSLRA